MKPNVTISVVADTYSSIEQALFNNHIANNYSFSVVDLPLPLSKYNELVNIITKEFHKKKLFDSETTVHISSFETSPNSLTYVIEIKSVINDIAKSRGLFFISSVNLDTLYVNIYGESIEFTELLYSKFKPLQTFRDDIEVRFTT